LCELVTGPIDGHSGLKVVHAAQDKGDPPAIQSALGYSLKKVAKGGDAIDIVVTGLKDHVRIDLLQGLPGSPCLGHPSLLRPEEQPIHVGELHTVIVKQQELPNPTAGQHLGRHTSNPSNSHNGDSELANPLSKGRRKRITIRGRVKA